MDALPEADKIRGMATGLAMAYQEGERAKAMNKPDMRRPIENTAQRFAALAAKFEAGTASTATHSSATRPQGRSC